MCTGYHSFVGGGFGGKESERQVVEAARLSKLTGRPVQVAWSREEEFFYDTFRPAAIVKIRSGVTEANQIAYWNFDVYFRGPRGAEQFYDIPITGNSPMGIILAFQVLTPSAQDPGARLEVIRTPFARESHIDLMAAKLKMDRWSSV